MALFLSATAAAAGAPPPVVREREQKATKLTNDINNKSSNDEAPHNRKRATHDAVDGLLVDVAPPLELPEADVVVGQLAPQPPDFVGEPRQTAADDGVHLRSHSSFVTTSRVRPYHPPQAVRESRDVRRGWMKAVDSQICVTNTLGSHHGIRNVCSDVYVAPPVFKPNEVREGIKGLI